MHSLMALMMALRLSSLCCCLAARQTQQPMNNGTQWPTNAVCAFSNRSKRAKVASVPRARSGAGWCGQTSTRLTSHSFMVCLDVKLAELADWWLPGTANCTR